MSASRWSRTLLAAVALSAAAPAIAAAQFGPDLIDWNAWYPTATNGFMIGPNELVLRPFGTLAPDSDWSDPDVLNIPAGPVTLVQDFVTTPGRTYRLTFTTEAEGAGATFDALWHDAPIADWATHSDGVLLTAISANTSLAFTSTLIGTCTGGGCDYWEARVWVRDITLREVGVTTTPEPATFALVAGGLAVLGVAARRRKA